MVTNTSNNDFYDTGCKLGAALSHDSKTTSDLNNFQNYISHHREKLSTTPQKQEIHKNKKKTVINITKVILTAFKRLFRNKKKNKIICDSYEDIVEDFIYENARDTSLIYKLPNCFHNGRYMYKEEAFRDPSIRVIQPKDLPAEILNQYRFGYSYFHVTQLGVGYSSNNAGDGPRFIQRDFQYASFHEHALGFQYDTKSVIIVSDESLTYHLLCGKNVFFTYSSNFPTADLIGVIRQRNLKRDLLRELKSVRNQTSLLRMRDYYNLFINYLPTGFIISFLIGYFVTTLVILILNLFVFQEGLGVEYSSNDAGDGPINFTEIKKMINDHFKEPELCRISESIILLIYDIRRVESSADVFVAVGRFLREHYKGNMLEIADKRIRECYDILFREEIQSDENVFSVLREYLSNFEAIKNSPLYKKCYKLLMYLLSFVLFRDSNCSYDSFGYTNMEAAAMRMKYHAGPDMIYTILDTISYIGEKGYDIYYHGLSMDTLLSSGKFDHYMKECRAVRETCSTKDQMEVLDESALLAKVDELLTKGEDYLKCRNLFDKFELVYLQKCVSEMRLLKLDILSFRCATRARQAPFAILLYGNSGIGKSSFLRVCISACCNKMDLENDDSHIYIRNAIEKYWNNFRTHMHTIVMDDITIKNPNLGDSSGVDEVIQVCNDVNFVPDQAALEDKGRIPCRAKLVIATTNVKDLHAYEYFSNASAIQRRLKTVVSLEVKEEYKNPVTGTLDPTLCPEVEEGAYPDLWKITVEIVKPHPIVKGSRQPRASFVKVLDGVDMETYIDWLYEAIDKYNEEGSQVKESLSGIKNVKICHTCFKPIAYCKCIQSASMTFISCVWWYAWVVLFWEWFYAVFLIFIQNWTPDAVLRFFLMRNLNNPIVTSMIMKRIGDKIKNRSKPTILLFFAGAALGLRFLYTIYSKAPGKVQGSNQSKEIGKQPAKDDSKDTECIWYKNNFELTTADVTRTILSSKSLEHTRLMEIFSKNCAAFTIPIGTNIVRKGKMFAVTGQLYLTNNHSIPTEGSFIVHLFQQSQKEGVNSNITFTLNQNDIIRNPSKDICLVIIRCLPPKKNLLEYFPNESYEANTHGEYLYRNENGSITNKEVLNIKVKHRAQLGHLPGTYTVWQGMGEKTENGDCGSILVSKSAFGTCIVGIHVLGYDDVIVALKVSREDISKLVDKAHNYSVGNNPPILQSANENIKVSALHAKSVYRYIDEGKANVFGSIVGFRPQHKSSVEDTPMKEVVAKVFSVNVQDTVPDMTYKPWRAAALDLCNIPNNIDTSVVDLCVDSFANDIISQLSDKDKANLHIYDQFTSVNGAQGVRFVDKINRNTSAGFPFKKSKKYYIEKIPEQHGLADPVEVSYEIQEQINEMKERLKNYEVSGCVFNAHLKDEPVSLKKKAIGKTRVFSGANFPWTVITRQYLLSFVRVLQTNNLLFEAAIGVNHFSNEWENFYQYLTKYGETRCIAGDYSKFDKRMAPTFILAAFDLIAKVLRSSGNYNQQDLDVIRCLAYDVAFAYQDFNGDLVRFFGGNPSGHSLTVIVNGIVNSLYMRYAYYHLNPLKEIYTFKKNVNLLTYGDDNIANINVNADWFTHTAISEELAKIGVVYTMADKEAESVPYISIKECSFLKRTWRYERDLGLHVGPLDLKSVYRSLSVWVRSKSITAEEQMIEIIGSANAEFFSHGREVFDAGQTCLREVIREMNLKKYITDTTLLSYDELIKRHMAASQ